MKSRHSPVSIVVCALLLAPALSWAQAAGARPDPREAIAKKVDVKVEDVRKSPVEGIYEVTRGAEVSYATSDARYFIVGGDLYDVETDANITENRRRGIRSRLIETVPESEMLVFSPKDPKYTITVFTDIDCGYCRRMHSQMAEYNRLGIRVRYLFFPRSGPDTDSWHKAENVWCSANRNDALTRAKHGEDVKAPKCPSTIVARDYELARKLGVDGTPAVFLSSGEMLPGYLPPAQLMRYIKTGKVQM